VGELRYRTVHEDLLAALPDLRAPYQRLFDDWDTGGGEPPGQYIVFSDTYGKLLEVTLTLREGTAGREEVLRQALDFGEAMLSAPDAAVNDLAIDALAERLDGHPDGRAVAERLGGPALRAWFKAYGQADWQGPEPDEIIDLWGVREAIAPRFPGTRPHELPGISYPSASPDLESLDAARAAKDAVVMLAAYGTTHLCAVMRANEVGADPATLDDLAVQLAEIVGGELPRGGPSTKYLRIPRGERVWNMHTGDERHCRLWDEPWVADPLRPWRAGIFAVLRGEADLSELARRAGC
jgi:hypothetical protein